jgi:hypothetical protein
MTGINTQGYGVQLEVSVVFFCRARLYCHTSHLIAIRGGLPRMGRRTLCKSAIWHERHHAPRPEFGGARPRKDGDVDEDGSMQRRHGVRPSVASRR